MKTYIIGDIHGQLDHAHRLLQEAKLADTGGAWIGGDSVLWFIGDLVDRGPDGIGVVDLVMRLQSQAPSVGGSVHCLLGNHEIQLLAAHRFVRDSYFVNAWRRNGGQDSDIARLTQRHVVWMRNLPAMARLDKRLLVHADATLYLGMAPTVEGVNAAFRSILNSDDANDWEDLIGDFSEHRAFASMRRGEQHARDFLRHYGGEQLVHGHTPIQIMADVIRPTGPFFYLDNRVVNVDGGMAMGAQGFIWQIA
ncbi:MAG: serine/threonine protein phosphatase [Chloroflexi bacterium]|nr:serine/threonine protein phosphatase [Chloroflexota bacterium]